MNNSSLYVNLRSSNIQKLELLKKQLPIQEEGSFSNFISNKMKFACKTRKNIAEYIWPGMDNYSAKTETIKKIINKPGYTTQRDRIIIICFSIGLNAHETNCALQLYGMKKLIDTDWRDCIIICALNNYESLNQVNRWLEGQDLKPLSFDVAKKADLMTVKVPKATLNNELWNRARDIKIIAGSNWGGVECKYNPVCFKIDIEQLITLSDGIEYTLWYSGQVETIEDSEILDDIIVTYIAENDMGPHCFSKLKPHIKKELTPFAYSLINQYRYSYLEIFLMLDDTKNFKLRVTAKNNGQFIRFFAETFNADHPWQPEYYQLEIIPNRFIFSVTSGSVFINRCYPDYDEYYKDYRNQKELESKKTACEANIDSLINTELVKTYNCYFQELILAITILRENLVNGNECIVDFDLSPDEITHLFDVEKDIVCDEYGYCPDEASFNYSEPGFEPIEISMGLLKRAYMLGFVKLSDVYNTIIKHGSIEGILKDVKL